MQVGCRMITVGHKSLGKRFPKGLLNHQPEERGAVMAKIKVNPILEQIRGQVGDLVFKRYGDKVILSRKPDTEGRQVTEGQSAARGRFREASVYGKLVMADAESKGVYEKAAAAKGQPVFSLIMADFLNAPSVDEVDLSGYRGQIGDLIAIRAHDDFQVVGVHVLIERQDGQVIEQGDASETGGRWHYTATQAVPTGTTVRITVTAKDRPGGKGETQQEKAV